MSASDSVTYGSVIHTLEDLGAPLTSLDSLPSRVPSCATATPESLDRHDAASHPSQHPDTGDPQPGNRNDSTVYRDSGIKDQIDDRPVMTDGGYQDNPEVIMPYRKPRDGSELSEWKEELNSVHRTVRARVEHTLARMKCWKILRDYRRAASTLADAVSGIAHLHNIAITGCVNAPRGQPEDQLRDSP
jgi:hypothetical protein